MLNKQADQREWKKEINRFTGKFIWQSCYEKESDFFMLRYEEKCLNERYRAFLNEQKKLPL